MEKTSVDLDKLVAEPTFWNDLRGLLTTIELSFEQ